jgi:predicted Rossmann fold nucleotide-binding protein DprA/Smf involved in DNA uptake
MAILKRDLQAVKKDIKALERKMETLLKAFGKPQKAKAAKKPKRKTVKAKARRAVAVKKAVPRKKAAKTTSTEQILKIVRRSRKGVDVPTLKTKTGFEDKKVRNIIFRASKEGKIKKVGRGIYVGV